MVTILLEKNGEKITANMYDITTDLRYSNVALSSENYAARWVKVKEFFKQYKFLGMVKDININDINSIT